MSQSQYVVDVSPIRYSEDTAIAEFVLSLKTPDKIGGFSEALDELNMLKNDVGEPAGVNTIITGLPVLLQKVTTLLITDNLNTILITLALIFGILYWYFKNLKMTILTTSAAIIGLIFLGAGMVIFNIAVTITLAAVGVLALGLGADYSIHIAIHYKHNKQKGMKTSKAVITTVEELWKPITASFLTTLAGFVALMLGVSPSSQSQGMVLALFSLSFFGFCFIYEV
jgi:predicted RND superfamily exporter protein